MQYRYSDQILLSYSSDISKNDHLISFLSIISEIIQCNLIIFYTISIFDLIQQFVPKYYTLFAKISNRLVDLVFEISLDSKFLIRGEIFLKMSTAIRNLFNCFENLS